MGKIPGAKIRCKHAYLQLREDKIGAMEIRCGHFQRSAQHRSDFPCDSQHALAIGTVGCNGNIKDIIIKTRHGVNVCPRNGVPG